MKDYKQDILEEIWNGTICISEKEYSKNKKEYINNIFNQIESLLNSENNNNNLTKLNNLYLKVINNLEVEAFKKGINFAIEINDSIPRI